MTTAADTTIPADTLDLSMDLPADYRPASLSEPYCSDCRYERVSVQYPPYLAWVMSDRTHDYYDPPHHMVCIWICGAHALRRQNADRVAERPLTPVRRR